MRAIVSALKIVMALPIYRLVGGISFAGFLALYLMTLPSEYTGGKIGLRALQYLNVESVIFSGVMAALAALLVPLMLYLLRRRQRIRTLSAGSSILVGMLTPMLCCSPLLPIALGIVASVFPSLVRAIGLGPQRFIATHQTGLLVAAALLLFLALYQNAKKVINGASCRV